MIERNLSCGRPSVEVRAGLGILAQTLRAREMLELEQHIHEQDERLRLLEERAAASAERRR